MLRAKNGLSSPLIPISTLREVSQIKVRLIFKTFLVGVCYRPPDFPVNFADNLDDVLEDVQNKFPHSTIILTGDFNYPWIDWATKKALSNSSKKNKCSMFIELTNIFQLNQLVTEPIQADSIFHIILPTHF